MKAIKKISKVMITSPDTVKVTMLAKDNPSINEDKDRYFSDKQVSKDTVTEIKLNNFQEKEGETEDERNKRSLRSKLILLGKDILNDKAKLINGELKNNTITLQLNSIQSLMEKYRDRVTNIEEAERWNLPEIKTERNKLIIIKCFIPLVTKGGYNVNAFEKELKEFNDNILERTKQQDIYYKQKKIIPIDTYVVTKFKSDYSLAEDNLGNIFLSKADNFDVFDNFCKKRNEAIYIKDCSRSWDSINNIDYWLKSKSEVGITMLKDNLKAIEKEIQQTNPVIHKEFLEEIREYIDKCDKELKDLEYEYDR